MTKDDVRRAARLLDAIVELQSARNVAAKAKDFTINTAGATLLRSSSPKIIRTVIEDIDARIIEAQMDLQALGVTLEDGQRLDGGTAAKGVGTSEGANGGPGAGGIAVAGDETQPRPDGKGATGKDLHAGMAGAPGFAATGAARLRHD